MALTLEQLRSAFKNTSNKDSLPNNYYPFWNMKDGEQTIVRFLPDLNEDNPFGFLVEKMSHRLVINGENKTVACLKQYGEDCPICKVSSAYYKDDDKENGKKYWRSKQHIAQALIVEDPLPADQDSDETNEGKVKLITLGYQIYNVIKQEFEGGDLEEMPFLYEGGTNFIIKKSKQGDWSSYGLGSKFARKSTDLDNDTIAFVQDQLIDLSTALPANPGLERVETMLEAALSGKALDEGENDDDAPVARVKVKATKAKSAVILPDTDDEDEEDNTPVAAVEEPTSSEADDADQILQSIRRRRSAKKE